MKDKERIKCVDRYGFPTHWIPVYLITPPVGEVLLLLCRKVFEGEPFMCVGTVSEIMQTFHVSSDDVPERFRKCNRDHPIYYEVLRWQPLETPPELLNDEERKLLKNSYEAKKEYLMGLSKRTEDKKDNNG